MAVNSHIGSGSWVLDGILVKINEKYLPPTRVTLPLNFEVGNPSELLFLEYNFSLEENVIAVSEVIRQKWEEEMKQIALKEAEEEAELAARTALDEKHGMTENSCENSDAIQNGPSATVSSNVINSDSCVSNNFLASHAPTKAATISASNNSSENTNNSHSVITSESKIFSQCEATSAAISSIISSHQEPVTMHANFSQILKPLPVTNSSKPSPPKESTTQLFDLKDFETIQDPFERLELETLNDREELKQVLSQAMPPNFDNRIISPAAYKPQSLMNAVGPDFANMSNKMVGPRLPIQNVVTNDSYRQSQNLANQHLNNLPHFKTDNVGTSHGGMPFAGNMQAANYVVPESFRQQNFNQIIANHLPNNYYAGNNINFQNSNYKFGADTQLTFAANSSVRYNATTAPTQTLIPNALPAVSLHSVHNSLVPVTSINNQIALPKNNWMSTIGNTAMSGSLPKSIATTSYLPLSSHASSILQTRTNEQTEFPQKMRESRTLRSAKSWTDIREAINQEEKTKKIIKPSKTPPPYTDSERLERYNSRPVQDLRKDVTSTVCAVKSSSNSNAEVKGKTSPPFLSSEASSFINGMVDMGFERTAVLRALERFGPDNKLVIDHLCLVQKFVEKGYRPTDVEWALFQYGQKEEKVLAHLKVFHEFLEMGFPEEKINKALLLHNLDREKVLDALLQNKF